MEGQLQNQGNDKRKAVESMFDSIAWRYDFLNHFLSFGIDKLWRRRVVSIIARHYTNPYILDVATGTGDLAIAAVRISPRRIAGIDISNGMLEIGRNKIIEKGYSDIIELRQGDSENIQFESGTFDVSMVAFGVRNFSDPLRGLKEMGRVLRNGGMIVVLEFSRPTGFPFRHIYNFYFRNVLPFFGRLFSKHGTAYNYLPDSVMKFPDNEKFLALLSEAGFSDCRQVKLTGGVASIYTGVAGGAQ